MTTHEAKRLVRGWLAERDLPDLKLTARTVDLEDLARATPIFVTVHDWEPNPAADELRRLSRDNGFFVQFHGRGFIS